MCCLVLVAGFLGPRIGILFMWIFSDRMSVAFDSFWIAALGFILLPWTTLMWAIAYQPVFGVRGFGWFLVAIGFVIDIATYVGGARRDSYQRA